MTLHRIAMTLYVVVCQLGRFHFENIEYSIIILLQAVNSMQAVNQMNKNNIHLDIITFTFCLAT